MPPKKGKKMALNDFLVDETLGSWADEMDSLPSAPTFKTDEDRFAGGDRRRDYPPRDRDFASRDSGFPPRQELPLPTSPPYIAFIGNLSFDIYEDAITEFFAPSAVKEIKIIKDRDEKPKGFGYVEFESLDGLKDALSRSGGQLANRTVRVSVADPPKERAGGFDDERLEGPWRRQGPLPPLPGPGPSDSRRPSGGFVPREGTGEPPAPSVADTVSDWRSSRRGPLPPPPDRPGLAPRRPSVPPSESDHPAHTEQTWAIGSKFKPSEPPATTPTNERRSLFGGNRADAAVPSTNPEEVSDWRSGPRRTVSQTGSTRGSPTTSTPPTPQLGGRRKLELLPRGAASPATESPLSSPRSASATPAKASPFGAARPIDVSNREKEVEERLEQERAARAATAAKEKESSRSSFSRGAPASKSDPASISGRGSNPNSPRLSSARALPLSPRVASSPLPSGGPTTNTPAGAAPKKEFSAAAAALRPKFSFAAAAGGVKADGGAEKAMSPSSEGPNTDTDALEAAGEDEDVNKITEQVAEVSV